MDPRYNSRGSAYMYVKPGERPPSLLGRPLDGQVHRDGAKRNRDGRVKPGERPPSLLGRSLDGAGPVTGREEMNERQMIYLHTIAAEGSLVKAARTEGKNLSTMTRALKETEEELGLRIFRRSGTGLILTSEGEAVLKHTERLRLEMGVLPHGSEAAVRHFWSETDLRYLLTIREHKNITGAAEECYIAQSSLSQWLSGLEGHLGDRIFTRSKFGVKETDFGKDLMDKLEKIRELYSDLQREQEELQELKTGVITIGIPMDLGAYLLPRILPAFSSQYPSIRIRIRENNSRELEKLLRSRKIDFAIIHLDGDVSDADARVFAEDPFCLVVPKALQDSCRFSKGAYIPAEELKQLDGAPFIMLTRQQKLRNVADRILSEAGVTPVIRCSTRNMETAKRLAASGMGFSILPQSYLDLYSEFSGMESYNLDPALHASWSLAISGPGEGTASRLSREFLRMLEESLWDQRAGIR